MSVVHRHWPNMKSHFYCCWFEFIPRAALLLLYVSKHFKIQTQMLRKQKQKLVSTTVSRFKSRRFPLMWQGCRQPKAPGRKKQTDEICLVRHDKFQRAGKSDQSCKVVDPLPPRMRSVFTLITFYKRGSVGGAAVASDPRMERDYCSESDVFRSLVICVSRDPLICSVILPRKGNIISTYQRPVHLLPWRDVISSVYMCNYYESRAIDKSLSDISDPSCHVVTYADAHFISVCFKATQWEQKTDKL